MVGCVVSDLSAFTTFGAFGSAVVEAPPLGLQPGPEPASAAWIPIPPIIKNELTARNAMVAKRIVLLFIF
jgi:hypothetical protein